MSAAPDDFFIGWAERVPRPHRRPLAATAAFFLLAMLLLALGLVRTIDDSGAGGGDWAAGEQTLTGIVTTQPWSGTMPLLSTIRMPVSAGVLR